MNLKIKNELLSDTLASLEVLLDEATFKVSKDGISVRSMDASRVAMVDFTMEKAAFESYETEPLNFCINLKEFQKVVKRAQKDEMITLGLKGDRMDVEIKGQYYRLFSFKVLEPTEEEVPMPKIDSLAVTTLTTEGLLRALEDASLTSDHVTIQILKQQVRMSTKGDLIAADIKFSPGDEAFLKCEAKEEVKVVVSLNYLVEIVKAVKEAETVNLHVSTDMPIKLQFGISYAGKLDYYLAPRIDVM